MLSRLTRLSSMSSHVVGGLSHLWDDRTAPKGDPKSILSQLRNIGHDHGFYCVNQLADDISLSLNTHDDPFLGVPHVDVKSEWNDAIYSNHTGDIDLGGRLTPDDLIPWYERFDVTSNFIESFNDNRRSRQNSTSNHQDSEIPSAFMQANPDFSLLNECDWMSPVFDNNFLNDNMLSTDTAAWEKIDLKSDEEPLSESSNYTDSLYTRSSESPLIEDVGEEKKEVEYTPTGRVKRQCRRKTVMDIMREACEVPDYEEPVLDEKLPKTLTLGSYFAMNDRASSPDKPKARGVVVKPYVDAATFRRRVMNRESARKYRAKKRTEKFQFKRVLLDLEKKNVDLKVEIVGLENEIASMKREMNM